VLLRRRTALPPPPRSADYNWGFAHFLFKLLIGTADYLDDTAATVRAVELARRVNAAFAAAAWTNGRHPPGALLAAVAPTPHAGREVGAAQAWPGTLLVDYFIYETGGDNLVRACLSPAAERLSHRYVPPHEVSALLRLGAQWQDLEMFREVSDDPEVNLLHLLPNTWTASGEVPDDAYDDWLDEALLGTDLLGDAQDVHRLVVMPWNYLHNIPFHLLPEIRRRIDAGQLDEVVISPGLGLTQRLAERTPAPCESASCLFVGIDSDELDARAEYAVVRESFDRTTALMNRDATPQGVLAAVAGVDAVHFACHGELDLRENAMYLLLAGDERLYPADLALSPGLRADLVVLNACVSGVSSRQARNGDPRAGPPGSAAPRRRAAGDRHPLAAGGRGGPGVRSRLLPSVARAGVKTSLSRAGTAEIRLESAVPLAFAVELYELGFDPETGGVRLRQTVVPVRVRNSRRVVNRERLVPAADLGRDGDLFV
jgi:hypothetical protein